MDYYSLKMRASEEVEDETAEVLADGSRPTREQHISGAERIVTRVDVDTWQEGLNKAFELVEKSVAKAAHNNSVILSEAKNLAFLADFRQQPRRRSHFPL